MIYLMIQWSDAYTQMVTHLYRISKKHLQVKILLV